MRVAIFTGTFVKNKDGVARSLYELVRSLRKRGHEVGIWTPEYTPMEDPGVTFFKIPSIPILFYPEYRMTIYFKNISKELRMFRPDIIEVSTQDFIALKFLKYGLRSGIPVVTVFHTDLPSYMKFYHIDLFERWAWWIIIRNYNKCHMVYAPTMEVKKLLHDKGAKKVNIWSRGIRVEDFSPEKRSEKVREQWGANGKNVVLYSGRFVKYKNIEMVKAVYNRIQENGRRDVLFVLMGKGPLEYSMKTDMKDAVFPGYLSGEDLTSSYASADIFLFPSTTETFGNVVLEAISSGLPAIVSDRGGCKETVQDSGCGIVCKAKSEEGFYEAVIRLLDDTELRDTFRENGKSWSETRTWDRINNGMIDELEEIAKK